MKQFFYKVVIASIAIILIYKFTIGKELNQINEKINSFSTKEGRKNIISSIKKEIEKANNRENYLDEKERLLIKNFIKKIKKELELKD